MRILDFLFGRRQAAEASAGIAKERLQIVLSHERASRDAPSFLPALQRDLLAVVGKYVAVKEDFLRVNFARRRIEGDVDPEHRGVAAAREIDAQEILLDRDVFADDGEEVALQGGQEARRVAARAVLRQ